MSQVREAGTPNRFRPTLVAAVLGASVLVPMLLLFLGAWLRWAMKCDEGCYLRDQEPGHAWTRYEGSWQWDAQFAVAVAGLVAAGAAVYLARKARPALCALAALLALVLGGAWIGWYSASPLHG